MALKFLRWSAVALIACSVLGCAVRFSPQTIRQEIFSQRGQDPLGVYEMNLGRFTTLLLRSALSDAEGNAPFAGLERIQLAIYQAPSERGPAIDVTLMDVHGWEPVLRVLDEGRSGMVLVRSGKFLPWSNGDGDATVGDIVFVGAGRQNVVYARLRGVLGADLPNALGDAFRDGGPDEVRRVLTELGAE